MEGLAEERSQQYVHYPGRPIILDPNSGQVLFGRKNISLHLENGLGNKSKTILIPQSRQYDLVGATLMGLNDALVRAEKGVELRDKLEAELERYQSLHDERNYGVYAYYPNSGDLVRFAPQFWHRLALVTSNSTLYLDPQRRLGWEEVRQRFDNLLVAVAGASVGSNVARAIAMDIRPERLKIGDPNLFKVSNANRVWLSYNEVVWSNHRAQEFPAPLGLKNKAIGAAESIHRMDPFMEIWAYYEGIDQSNLDSFVGGNNVEPAADIVAEETDQPDAKMAIRLQARKLRKRVIMATDVGSWIQIDIRHFDLDPDATLAFGISDDELQERQEMVRRRPGLESFFSFVDGLIGPNYRDSGEFGDLLTGRLPKWTASMPQLGSTAAVAAGMIAEVIARTALGHRFPERFIFNKRDLTIIKFGERV